MTNISIDELIASQRAEFDRADRFSGAAEVLHFFVLWFSVLVVNIGNDTYRYLFTFLTLFFVVAIFYLTNKSKDMHLNAERLRRAVVSISGLGFKIEASTLRDILANLTIAKQGPETAGYYASTEPVGIIRQGELTEQSAFWTANLAKATARHYWLFLVFFLVCTAALVLFISYTTSFKNELAQLLCVLCSWIVTSSILTSALNFSRLANSAKVIEKGLSQNTKPSEIQLFVSDYDVLVSNMPTIPTRIYKRKEKGLNAIWEATRKVQAAEPV